MLLTAAAIGLMVWCGGVATATPGVTQYNVTAAGVQVQAVRVDLNQARVHLALAWDHVGRTQSLGQIASRAKAVAAINGSFFEAYTSAPFKNPIQTLVEGGEMVHRGDLGTFLGFDMDGRPHMGRMTSKIVGALDGSWDDPNDWYAYWINHYPVSGRDNVTIFDRWFGVQTPHKPGFYAVVKGGVIRWTGTQAPAIPQTAGDFVVYFGGSEVKVGRQRFRCGRRCEYKVEMKGWVVDEVNGRFSDGLAAGPRLLANGEVKVAPASEGFGSPKILSERHLRSAVGYSRDRSTLIMFAAAPCTMHELAWAAKSLGLYDAMNLDGGGSTSLWYAGRYLTGPGRDVSSALVVVPTR